MKQAIKKARKVFHLKRALTIQEILQKMEEGWELMGFNLTFLVKEDRRINIHTGCCFEVKASK